MSSKNGYTIKPYTVAVRMRIQAMVNHWYSWRDEVAEEYGVPMGDLARAFTDYAAMSARVDRLPKGTDFELLTPFDDDKSAREKFIAYLDTVKVDLIRQIEIEIERIDAPQDAVLAPNAEPTDPEA